MKFLACTILTIAAMFCAFSIDAAAQRDYFTPEEIELIRDAQKIDDRMATLTKIIDRRFDALKIDVGGAKIAPKESDRWGVLPDASRQQLLLDVKRILQKAIDDIDSLAERPDSAILPEPDDKRAKQSFKDIFPKAVRHLAAAAKRYQPALKAELDRPNNPSETGSVLDSLEFCAQIIAAVEKLPTEVVTTKKSRN